MGRVAYASTSDGVRIACAVHGRALPVVYMPPLPFRHLELEWESPGDRRVLEWLAGQVRADPVAAKHMDLK